MQGMHARRTLFLAGLSLGVAALCAASPDPAPLDGIGVAARFGYSREDSTRFLQAALDSGARRIVLEAKDGPWITARPLKGRSNQTIVFEKGTYLQAKRGAFKGRCDALLTFTSCTNAMILGAGPESCGLRMWRSDYDDKSLYTHAEWRHGISLLSCVNVRIEGISVVDTGGDGLYVSTDNRRQDHDGRRGCRNVVVRNCVFDRNYRQGISVIGVDGFLVEDVVLANTHGTPPQAGIDFEPNKARECIRNVVMRRCRIEGNAGSGIEFAYGHLGADTEASSIMVEDSIVIGNRRGFHYAVGEEDLDCPVDSGSVAFRGCTFRETLGHAVFISKRSNCRGAVSFTGCRFENCGVDSPEDPEFVFSVNAHTLCEPDSFTFDDVTVVRKAKRPLMRPWKRKGPYRGRPTRFSGDIRIVSGGEVEMLSFDDAWRRENCPFTPVATPPALFRVVRPLDGMQVVDACPGEQLPCAPAFLRGRGRFAVFHAEAGQEVRIELMVARVGRRSFDVTRPFVIYPHGGMEAIARIEPPRSAKAEMKTFTVPRSGFYDIFFDTAMNGAAVRSCNVPIALDVTEGMVQLIGVMGAGRKWILSAKERFSFFAPGGMPVECDVSCSSGECVSLEVFDPSGERRCRVPTVDGVERYQGTASVDGFWEMAIGAPEQGAFEDFLLGVRGVPGWIFLSRGRAWK